MALLTINEADSLATARGYSENLLQYTEAFSNWTISDISIVNENVTTEINPIGNKLSTQLHALGGGGNGIARQAIAVTANFDYVFSVYLRAFDTTAILDIHVYNAAFDTVIGNTNVILTSVLWKRVSVTVNVGAETSVWVAIGGENTFAGENIIAWGAQLSKGVELLSYIKGDQDTAPTHRSQDALTYLDHPRQMHIGDRI